MFVNGANITVPTVAVVLRKAYGLGAQSMMGGSTKAPLACLAWPTGEFGGMGLEGAVRLGYRRELDAIGDPAEREKAFDDLVARAYEVGKGVSVASYFEIDDVIDPADTRRWLVSLLGAAPPPPPRTGKKRPNIDTW
jgi:acetyl-CoA carboxylase carboxyltransferase component